MVALAVELRNLYLGEVWEHVGLHTNILIRKGLEESRVEQSRKLFLFTHAYSSAVWGEEIERGFPFMLSYLNQSTLSSVYFCNEPSYLASLVSGIKRDIETEADKKA